MVNIEKENQGFLMIRGWELGQMLKKVGITKSFLSKIGKNRSTFYEWFTINYRGENILEPVSFYAVIQFINASMRSSEQCLKDMSERLIEMRRNNEFENEYFNGSSILSSAQYPYYIIDK